MNKVYCSVIWIEMKFAAEIIFAPFEVATIQYNYCATLELYLCKTHMYSDNSTTKL